jgi:hypothetical protein
VPKRLFAYALIFLAAHSAAIAAGCGDGGGAPAPIPSASAPAATPTGERSIAWNEAVDLIMDCEVAAVFQAHSLVVGLTLRDGSRARTVEPRIDMVFDVVSEAVAGGCEQIPLATE